jgi:formate hydrogenlyase transcriptional activator
MILSESRAASVSPHPPASWCIAGSQEKAEASEARTVRLRLMCELTNNLVTNRELDDLIREAAAGARRVVPSDIALVGLLDSEGYRLQVKAFDAGGELRFDNRQADLFAEVLAARVFSNGKPWAGGAAELVQENVPKPVEWAAIDLNCISVLPLVIHDQALGILALGRSGHNFYTQDEVEFLTQVASQLAIAVENVAVREELRKLKGDYAEETLDIEDEVSSEPHFAEIVGRSAALQRALRQVEVVAPTDSGVLILGETGTGKELIARAIHHLSDRRDRPFVKLNCAAIPSGLLESELFGHERGAFTGAIMRKAGRFEVADKGTLFLDEVGDIPLDLQPKLLRVLQEHEFERLGSNHTQQVDVRVVAATHRDLKQMVEEGEFRSDLYYRLHVFPLSVPPLRERREDIPLLVRHFVDEYARRMKRRIENIPAQSMEALTGYSWPGNVRELQNFIERAVILSPGSVLRPPLAELKEATIQDEPSSDLGTLEEIEREHVLRAVKASNWKIGGPDGAAARLGMKRTTLAYRIRKLNIPLRPQ